MKRCKGQHGTRTAALNGLGFRVQGLGFRVQGLGFRVWGLGFRVCFSQGLELLGVQDS